MMMLTPALTKTQQKTEMSAEGKNLNLGLRVDLDLWVKVFMNVQLF